MKFIHTADWHLGKTLKNQSLIEDQKYILQQFYNIVDDQKVDAIIIAGDIYDRNVPPEEAVKLFDEVLNEIIVKRKIPLLCIAGNHDSFDRLNFGSKIFDKANLYIRAKITKEIDPIILNDEYGEIYFSLIPYFDPSHIKKIFDLEDDYELNCNDSMKMVIELIRKKIPIDKRSVAVAHAFVIGGKMSGSEKKLPGGLEEIDPSHFSKNFNYTALGHLHGVNVMAKNVRYSGSLLKYSFDEYKQEKKITLVEIDGGGNVKFDLIPLKPLRDVKIIRGKIENILENEPETEDYISIQYEGTNPPNLKLKLRNKFKNLLE
ncbi:MAG: exonuclease SbcCD subunit D, partial [Selenomonadaceae bacterium]|nr:exonuclease SbcCD subunit D [Selenomonadaceae bacterium]